MRSTYQSKHPQPTESREEPVHQKKKRSFPQGFKLAIRETQEELASAHLLENHFQTERLEKKKRTSL
jgi:hypothetical protein